jgi:hypothetical protein
MQAADPNPSGGPSLWWVWGEMKQAFGRLEQGLHATHARQDDMRREILTHIRAVNQRLDKKPKRHGLAWLAHVPWDRIVLFLCSVLGTLGWVKPEWIKMLTGAP